MTKVLDAYALRARLFPALLASASLLVVVGVIVPWQRLSIVHAAAALAVPVLLFGAADLARRAGKNLEPELYKAWGGMPSTRMLRHADTFLDGDSKAGYLSFLSGKLKAAPPTAAEETANPGMADIFYARCAGWLRENTRDTKKFNILFNENVTYGYRRNLFALKWPALIADAAILAVVFGYALYMRLELDSELALKMGIIAGVAVVHVLYMTFGVTENSVREAANVYSRQLYLSCEALGAALPTSRKRSAA
jgi:hypothetical protein